MERAILDLLHEVRNEKDDAKREALRRRTNPILAAHFQRHPHELQELAFGVLNRVWSDTMESDIVPQLIETKTVGLQEIDYIEENLMGGRAYWQGKGGQIRSFVIRQEREKMPTEEMVTAIDLHQDEFRTNFWGGFDKLVGQAREKMRQLPTHRLIELVRASVNASDNSAFYGSFAKSSLSRTQVDSILDEVLDRSEGVSILGTTTALKPLANIGAAFNVDVAKQVWDTGQVGQYFGVPLVKVQNFQDWKGRFVVPKDEIWIVGRNAGRLTLYGDTAKVSQLLQEAFQIRWETARDAGMLLYGADKGRIGRIKLT